MKKGYIIIGLVALSVVLPVSASTYLYEFPRETVSSDKVWELSLSKDLDQSIVDAMVVVEDVEKDSTIDTEVERVGNAEYKIHTKDYELGKTYRIRLASTDDVKLDKEYIKRFDIKNNSVGDSYLKTIKSDFDKFSWRVFHKNYDAFKLEGVSSEGVVLGGYSTEQGLADMGIKIGVSSKSDVSKLLGTPVEYITKGNINYTVDGKGEYETYLVGNRYVTVFYDIYNNSLVRSVLWIDEELHKDKPYYALPSEELQYASEDLMVELINETRVSFGLQPLKYDVAMNDVGRAHSLNMVNQDFFDHVDKNGRTVVDRVRNAGYVVSYVGENLAFGQLNAIYAHESLMNSLGHRENILNENYTDVGVGLVMKSDGTPYYTIVFYSK